MMNGQKPSIVSKRYRGVVVPMVTPIAPDGELDEPAVRRVVDYILAGGVEGIFVLGTTGEAASIPYQMRSRLVATAVEHVGNRATTYAGIGDSCLAHSIQAAQEYFRLGVDAVVAHLPYYYALSPQEQKDYYLALARDVPGPLMLYNIPSTTHMSIPVEVIDTASRQPRVVGLKDSENDLGRLEEVAAAIGGRADFSFLIGVSALSAKALAFGADGTVPSVGQLVPALCQSLYDSGSAGRLSAAENCQRQIDQVASICYRDRSLGQSLAALKAAMGARDLCGADVLPPLQALEPAEQEAVRQRLLDWLAQNEVAM